MFETKVDIDLPSGLRVRARALTIVEANLMADEAAGNKGLVYDQILAGCTTEILEPGPYKLDVYGKLSWGKVLLGDRFTALMHLRIATWGSSFDFRIPRCDVCRRPFDWTVPLDEMEVRALPDASRAKIAAGDNRFETVLPTTDKKVTFQLLTGEMERNAAKFAEDRPGERVSLSLSARIITIQDVEPRDKVKFLESLPMNVGLDLIDAMDEHDCGVKTTIEIEHQIVGCGATMEVEVPFGGSRTYWVPKRRKS